MSVHDKILKKELQYTSNGTVCDVFKGSTHHGGLGLSFRFSTLRVAYRIPSKDLTSDHEKNAFDRYHCHLSRSRVSPDAIVADSRYIFATNRTNHCQKSYTRTRRPGVTSPRDHASTLYHQKLGAWSVVAPAVKASRNTCPKLSPIDFLLSRASTHPKHSSYTDLLITVTLKRLRHP